MVYIFHALFAVVLAMLVFCMNRVAEDQERLVRGLALAQKADAEAARIRLAMQFEAQQEALDKLRQIVEKTQTIGLPVQGTGERLRGSAQPVGHAVKGL